MQLYRGVIHGKTIELEKEVGLTEGQKVVVLIEPMPPAMAANPQAAEGLLRAFGGWADDDPEGLEEYLKWNRQQRKANREIED